MGAAFPPVKTVEIADSGALLAVAVILAGLLATFLLLWLRERKLRALRARTSLRSRYFSQTQTEGAVKVLDPVTVEIAEESRQVAHRFVRGGDLSVELAVNQQDSGSTEYQVWGVWTERDGAWTDQLGHLSSSTAGNLLRKANHGEISATLVSVIPSDPPVIKLALWSK